MNFIKNNISRIIYTLIIGFLLVLPSPASACSMSGIGHLFPLITGAAGLLLLAALVVAVIVLVVLYILYVFFVILLSRQASRPEGASKFIKVLATFFTIINTLLFFGLSSSNGLQDLSYLFFDLPMWGIPFYFYMKGMTAKPPEEALEVEG